MADRRSQSDESLIVEYFTIQPLAACDAVLNQISDVLRERRPRKAKADNAKPAAEPTERKTAQKRKAGKEAAVTADNDNPGFCAYRGCQLFPDDNIHHKQSMPGYHEFVEIDPDRIVDDVEPAGEASKGVGV